MLEVHMKCFHVEIAQTVHAPICLNSVAAKSIKNKSGWAFPQVAETSARSSACGLPLDTRNNLLDTRNRPGHQEQTSWTPHY